MISGAGQSTKFRWNLRVCWGRLQLEKLQQNETAKVNELSRTLNLRLNCDNIINNQESNGLDFNFLKENFKNPPSEYGLNCWWWWLNSNVTKEAITSDLEQIKNKGFNGALIFDDVETFVMYKIWIRPTNTKVIYNNY